MFYFIPGLYQPDSAATNRWMAYLRFFSESSIETRAVFFRKNAEGTSIDPMPHIHIKNYWKHCYLNKGLLLYVSLILYYIHFWLHLKKGDVIYCYEQVDVWKLFLKKGVKVYAEYTEHPEVVGFGGKFLHTSSKQFKEKCKELTGVFVISTALKNFFVELGVDENKVHIINMIVDEKRFEGLEKDDRIEPYIAYCGTVSNNKDGVDDLIKAFALFSKQHPEVRLCIIGRIHTNIEASNNISLIDKLGIKDKVILTGIVPSKDMPQLLKNACILALARPDNMQAKYGFPTKLGEYLMTANPVVVTSVGDIPLFLRDGVSAFVSAPNDIHCFSYKLCEAYENQLLSRRVGLEGEKVAETHFSYAIETKKMARLLGLYK